MKHRESVCMFQKMQNNLIAQETTILAQLCRSDKKHNKG